MAIKKLQKGTEELNIAKYLVSGELRNDLRNHTVPILDVFSATGEPVEFMVMPLLNMFDAPPFSAVDEVVDFMEQTLEVCIRKS